MKNKLKDLKAQTIERDKVDETIIEETYLQEEQRATWRRSNKKY